MNASTTLTGSGHGISSHDDSHGDNGNDPSGHSSHGLVLQYQPGLPLSRGKLIIWLFLSTEIMFFAALLGSYVVLRFGALVWPKPHHVHLSEPIGAFNTFVLICSSVTIVLSLEAAKGNRASRAKLWMLATLLLGSLFLGVKGYEYSAKFSHGIYPWSPRSRVFEKPDLYYGSAVRARLGEPEIIERLKKLDETPENQLTTEQLRARTSLSQVRKIVLVRPAVEAGESLGFLPGDLQAKINPYLRPLLDALREMIDYEVLKRLTEQDVVEMIPLAYMRGRTLNNAFIILDEAQNTTVSQMKMFLTRLGIGSRMVISGDTTQIDLPDNRRSGLVDAIVRLADIRGCGQVTLSGADIMRHSLVAKIVAAYDASERHYPR